MPVTAFLPWSRAIDHPCSPVPSLGFTVGQLDGFVMYPLATLYVFLQKLSSHFLWIFTLNLKTALKQFLCLSTSVLIQKTQALNRIIYLRFYENFNENDGCILTSNLSNFSASVGTYFSLSKSANKGEIMFICLVNLASTVFRFSFDLGISNCLPFSVISRIYVSFFSICNTGQLRYCTWWPTARWFVFPDPFHARWHPFLHRKDFPLEISLPASFVSFHVRFTLCQTVSAVKFILYSSRSTKRSTLCGGLQCKNHATITINLRVYKIFNPLASS